MAKKWSLLNVIFVFIFCSLCAEESQEKYLPAGDRTTQAEELVAPNQNAIEQETLTAAARIAVPKTARAGLYFTTHQGAFHSPVALWPAGEMVELEDGSRWMIASGDGYKTLNWLATDVVVITANQEWFSLYDFCLVNQNTGVQVRANLVQYLNPFFHTIYNHRIIAIDDVLRQIWLEDGSVWSISGIDYTKNWMIGDTIIIGINIGWLSYERPNILINANTKKYFRATCIY